MTLLTPGMWGLVFKILRLYCGIVAVSWQLIHIQRSQICCQVRMESSCLPRKNNNLILCDISEIYIMYNNLIICQNKIYLMCISSWGWGSIQSMVPMWLSFLRKNSLCHFCYITVHKKCQKNILEWHLLQNCSFCCFFTGMVWALTLTFR